MGSLCSISSGNLMAFTSSSHLDESSAKSWTFHVFVVDLNIAFTPYKYYMFYLSFNSMN
jgi:hypothetical protein